MTPRYSVAQLYSRLHSARVVHNDVALRHVLRSPLSGQLFLIDFEAAENLGSSPDNPLEWKIEEEKTLVEDYLNVSSAIWSSV